MRAGWKARSRTALLAVALAAALWPAGAGGQAVPADEVARLQEAGRLEARGALAEAERTLRAVLDERPESVPALLALERVLRIQGRLDELPPRLEAALAVEPAATVLNTLRLRTWSALDRLDALEEAAAAWIEASPEIEVPYREAARVWSGRGEHERARAVLEAGRRRIGGDDVLALELGDVYADLGEPELAVREWARAVAPGGRGGSQLRRRLRSLPDGGAAVVAELVDRLAADPSAAGRLDVALDLATEAGLEDRARVIAGTRFDALEPRERRGRLLELALEADARDLPRLAYWAYGRLLEDARALPGGEDASPVVRSRLAALAAELGDPAPGSVHGAGAGAAGPTGAERRRTAAARRLLEAGDVDAARAAYLAAAPGLQGADATEALSLATLLGRLSRPGGVLIGQALRLMDREEPGAAVDRLLAGSAGLALADRAPVLDFAARLADGAGLRDESRAIRLRIVDEHPEAPEAPASLMALARELGREGTTRPRARALLERLILEYPSSALVPQARRALDRLKREGAA